MTDLVKLIDAFGGIATRQQVIAAGGTGYALTGAVRAGLIRRVRQARYASPHALPSAVVATRVGGLLAGPSAAESYGLWSGSDTRVHVSVGSNSSRLRTNYPPSFRVAPLSSDRGSREIRVHWLKGGAVPELGPECWRVPLSVCLRQVVEWCEPETAIACLDTAITSLHLSPSAIKAVFADASAAARLTASSARRGSDSGLESLFRQRMSRLLPLAQQVPIPGVGRVDFRVVGTDVLIEVDGREHHAGSDAFERDRWRDAELTARGFRVIRFSYRRIIHEWPWCERMVLAALA